MPTVFKKPFPVIGMTCASCAASVEKTLTHQKGVVSAAVNFATNSATIEFDEKAADLALIKKAVQSTGYDIDISNQKTADEYDREKEDQLKKVKINAALSFAFSVPVAIMGMGFHHWVIGQWISMAFTTLVVFYFGRQFFVMAVKQLMHGRVNMDTLVALSTSVAFVFSAFNVIFPQFLLSHGIHPSIYFESAALITSFILLGKFFEEKAKAGTSGAIKKLIGLQPKMVRA